MYNLIMIEVSYKQKGYKIGSCLMMCSDGQEAITD